MPIAPTILGVLLGGATAIAVVWFLVIRPTRKQIALALAKFLSLIFSDR